MKSEGNRKKQHTLKEGKNKPMKREGNRKKQQTLKEGKNLCCATNLLPTW